MNERWEEAVGPLYDIAETSHILACSPEIVLELVGRKEILQVSDGRFPGWQFDLERLEVYPVLLEVLKIFDESGLQSDLAASFCVTPQPELDDSLLVLPVDLLENGGSRELVIAARRAASTLSS